MEEWRQLQLFALATLYYSLWGEHWPIDTSSVGMEWLNTSNSECQWYSTQFGRFDDMYDIGQFIENRDHEPICNSLGQYQVLSQYIYGQDMPSFSPALPPEIGLLTSLEHLEIRIFSLTGPLPSTLGLLTSLRWLDFRENHITGTLPTELGLLSSSLEGIQLYSNSIQGPLPSELGLLSSLHGLVLHDNALTGTLPSELGCISSMEYLSLNNNAFYGSIPSTLGQLSSAIRGLHLSNNALTGPLPEEFRHLTNLSWLLLGNNQLTGSIPSWMGAFTVMSSLNLTQNAFTGTIPLELHFFSSEYSVLILLSHNQLTGRIPSELGLMTPQRLRELHIDNNILTGPLPSELSLLTGLMELDVSANVDITGTIPLEFANLVFGVGDDGDVNVNFAFYRLNVTKTRLSGVIPEELCFLQGRNCYYYDSSDDEQRPCLLEFDCNIDGAAGGLCGCGDCTCME